MLNINLEGEINDEVYFSWFSLCEHYTYLHHCTVRKKKSCNHRHIGNSVSFKFPEKHD